MGVTTRLLELADVEELTELLASNRQFLAPWDPVREDAFFSEAKQLEITRTVLDAHAAGTMVPLVILNSSGGIAGRLNINGIVHGALESAALGYWVAEGQNGSGLASAAVADAVELAAGTLGLHRLEAGTLVHNGPSQRVLEKNGFARYGLAPQYLRIAGRWQDHIMFQKILAD